MTRLPDDDEALQLEVELLEASPADAQLARPDDGEGVREVEDGELVELGDHRDPAVPAGRFDVLPEGVAVSHRDGARQRREEPDLVLAEEAAARERRLPGRQDGGLREELFVPLDDVEDRESAKGLGGPGEVDDPCTGENEAGEAGGIPPRADERDELHRSRLYDTARNPGGVRRRRDEEPGTFRATGGPCTAGGALSAWRPEEQSVGNRPSCGQAGCGVSASIRSE